jgi:hypothetical protein
METQEMLDEFVDIMVDELPHSLTPIKTVMSPLWDIITGQRFMMTRVARWMLERV